MTETKGAIEEWEDVVGYEDKYEISNIGRLRNKNGYIKIPQIVMRGYVAYGLWGENQKKLIKAHRMVYQAFIGTIPSSMQINHINGDKGDNRVANLEVISGRDNVNHTHMRRKQSSMYPGVRKSYNKWRADAMIGKDRYYLGNYDTEVEAGHAYMDFLMSKGLSIKYALERFKSAELIKEAIE